MVSQRESSAPQSAALRPEDNLNVLFYQFFPGGGIGRYTHELASALLKRGSLDITVACSRKFEYLERAEYKTWPELMTISSANPLARRTRFLLAQYLSPVRFLKFAKAARADVLHFSNINHLTFPVWRRQLDVMHTRVVATVHDVRRAKVILNRGWEEHALRTFYRRCDALFVHSESQRADLQQFASVPNERIISVPHGPYAFSSISSSIESLKAKYSIPAGRLVCLIFGSIRDDKNIAETLRAVASINDKPYVVIAGSGGAKGNLPVEWYRRLVDELGIASDVKFIDRFIAEGEVAELFAVCDVVLLTYKSSFTSQSGVLNVATQYRRPVVVTSAPTMSETVTRFRLGVVCASDSLESIACGIRQSYSVAELRENAEFGAYERESSWARNAEITAMAYREIVQANAQN